jgi:hypothetical protein
VRAGRGVVVHSSRAPSRMTHGPPRPSALPPERIPPKKIPPTPEQLAKAAVAKRPSPVGRPDKVEVALRFTLPRAAMEKLTARAIREERSIESVVAELLEQ